MGEEKDANGPAPRGNSRRRKAMLPFAAVALGTVAAGAVYRWYRQTHISTDDAFVEGRIHMVAVSRRRGPGEGGFSREGAFPTRLPERRP